MLFDLETSHPSYLKSVDPPRAEVRPHSPLLAYHEFLEQKNRPPPPFPPSLPSPPYAPIQNRNVGAPSYFPTMLRSDYSHPLHGSEIPCMDLQTHLRSCRACQRFVMWQLWNEMGFYILLALVVIYLLRK